MIFKIFTAITFIAELIIAYTVITKLIEVDKIILQADGSLINKKQSIKEVGSLIRKISEQFIEFAYDFVNKLEEKRDEALYNRLNKLLIVALLFKFNSKGIRKLRRSMFVRRVGRGLSLLKYVI